MAGLRLEIFDTAPAPDGGLQPLVEVSALEEARIAATRTKMRRSAGTKAGWAGAEVVLMGEAYSCRPGL